MISDAALDLREFIRHGDTITWGQACGEPQTLTELLMAQRHQLAPFTVFLGIPAAPTCRPEHADVVRFQSYCGTATNRALWSAEALEILPVHYSTLPRLLSHGDRAADVVFVQVSAPDEHGNHSLGLADDYFSSALDTARVIIAEINDQVPFTVGARTLTSGQWTAAIHTSRRPPVMPTPPANMTTQLVAAHVARLIPDGATLQFGIGALPEACLAALREHNDLGIHSGIINDTAIDLIERGVATGLAKSIDRGVAIAGLFGGSERLFSFVHNNPAVQLRPTTYTHDHAVLAAQHRLVAINSALEVDLSGQVNAEMAGGEYVGAVGGAIDFLRGAAASPGGIPIIALPSTAGNRSRIVTRLDGPVSTPRTDAGIIVTEYGAADLRGLPIRERQVRMIAIAHPHHREVLMAEMEQRVTAGVGA